MHIVLLGCSSCLAVNGRTSHAGEGLDCCEDSCVDLAWAWTACAVRHVQPTETSLDTDRPCWLMPNKHTLPLSLCKPIKQNQD